MRTAEAGPELAHRSEAAARWVGGVVAGVGLLGLMGWWLDIAALRSVITGFAEMKPNTALGFVLCGLGLVSGAGVDRIVSVRAAAGVVVALVGAVTLGEYALDAGRGFDGLLVGRAGEGAVLRMTPGAAMAFVAAGLGMLLTAWPPRWSTLGRRVEVVCSVVPVGLGGLAMLGYLYGARSLYQTAVFSSMALHTSVMLVLVGVGLQMSRPGQGLAVIVLSRGAGGLIARRLLTFFVLLAPLMGLLRLKGQEAGWYDLQFGLALMVSSLMFVGVGIIWWTSRALERTDAWRAAMQADLAASITRERASAAQRGAILEALPLGIALLDTRGRVLKVNKGWLELSERGVAAGAAGAEFVVWARGVLGVDERRWAGVAEGVSRVLSGAVEGYLEEVSVESAAQAEGARPAAPRRVRWFEVRVAPVVEQLSGRGAVVTVSDVSERRRLEDQLVHAQKLEAVGRLAGGVAHDFNNLLTTVMGHRALAQAAVKAGQKPDAHLEAIEQAARSGAALTQELLAFGRRQIITPKVVEVGGLIESVRRLIERGLGDSVRLSVFVHEETRRVKVDPGRIEQVLLNMAINARDAMPGGGSVVIEAGNAELDEAYATERAGVEPGSYVCICVSDTGVGMSRAVMSRLFEPFFTTKEQGKGTGLGLATSFGIVKQHGGHIAVYSEEGRGTTFRVYLPSVDDPVSEGSAARGVERAKRGRERVLLVDDHLGARAAVAGMLRSLGYVVTEAGDGEAAERAVRASGPGGFDLLVCDVMLPDGTGPKLASRLRGIEGWAGLPVLFISGYTANAIVHQGVLDEGVQFLAKPFTLDELGVKVRLVLEGA